MSTTRLLAALAGSTVLLAAVATHSTAGTSFRLEVGSTAALGLGTKPLKDAKKAVLAVRALVCQDLANVQISGTAESLVDGKRQSLPLTLTVVDRAAAVYAIQQQWPQEGTWVLHLRGSCSNPRAEASTLAAVAGSTFIREKSEVLREPATKKQVDEAVAALARSRS